MKIEIDNFFQAIDNVTDGLIEQNYDLSDVKIHVSPMFYTALSQYYNNRASYNSMPPVGFSTLSYRSRNAVVTILVDRNLEGHSWSYNDLHLTYLLEKAILESEQ